MLKVLAILFGIAFIFAGVAGFLPEFTTDGMLFGYFHVDNMNNIAYVATGVIAIMAATSNKFTKLFFQVFGIIYLVAAMAGFWFGGNLYLMNVNFADNILHTVIGVLALYFGFFI